MSIEFDTCPICGSEKGCRCVQDDWLSSGENININSGVDNQFDTMEEARAIIRLAKELISSKLKFINGKIEKDISEKLKTIKLFARNDGTLNSAVISAAYYAKKNNKPLYIYSGNSFGHAVWRATYKESDANSPINNTGIIVYTISPDLTLMKYEIERNATQK
jgi:hypothetical protein